MDDRHEDTESEGVEPEGGEPELELDPRAWKETEAAALEAGRIGGPDPQPGVDPAERPRIEGGEGVSEGFEQAEDKLERNASHADSGADPQGDAGEPEPDSARSTAVYGEADSALSQDDVQPDDDDQTSKD